MQEKFYKGVGIFSSIVLMLSNGPIMCRFKKPHETDIKNPENIKVILVI